MDSIKILLASDFDLKKILKFEPFMFFHGTEPVKTVFLQGKPATLKFRQEGDTLHVEFDRGLTDAQKEYFFRRISYCLGATEGFGSFYVMCENDEVLSGFLESIQGNRIISAFDDFEGIVSIILSQNVGFRQYKDMTRRFVEKFGYGGSFPSPRTVIEKRDALKQCGVGYRDAFIIDAAKKMLLKSTLSDDDVNDIHGIGPYSRDIFRLFQRRDYSAFYVDTLIKKIFKEQYGANLETDADVRAFAQRKFGKYAGIAEVYLQKFLNDNLFFSSPANQCDGSPKKSLPEKKEL